MEEKKGLKPDLSQLSVEETHDELHNEGHELLEPGQHLLLVGAEHRVQDVRHLGQDVHVVLVLQGAGGSVDEVTHV